MIAEVDRQIVIHNPTDELISWCESELVVRNPDYYKLKNMGKWVGNIPDRLYLFAEIDGNIVVPFGCAKALMRFKDLQFKADFAPISPLEYHSGISTYDYQEQAVQAALRHKNGVIVMPCGAGKTQVALEIIARLGGHALWLTHTQDLLNQSLNRAKSVFGIDAANYGTITEGKINIGKATTFATVQTMSKIDMTQYQNEWNVVITDECHKAVGTPTRCMQFYRVLNNLCCRYKFGITATPKRSDGLEKTMFALIGPVIHTVDREAVAHTTCPVYYKMISTDYEPDLNIALAGDGTLNYSGLVNDLTHDSQRFDRVFNALNTLEGAVLVLGNRVEYLEHMCGEDQARSVCLSSLGQSKAAKAYRKKVLQDLNNGDIDHVYATYQLAKEGLDVPNLRYVVFATPEKDETTVVQAAGRVGRRADGKDHGTIIDFVDNFGMLRGWAKKRVNYYKKLGYMPLT